MGAKSGTAASAGKFTLQHATEVAILTANHLAARLAEHFPVLYQNAQGRFPLAQSPLRHAPHTVHDQAEDEWNRPYSRVKGCFPAGTARTDKYRSPVGRVDNVYGDRNLFCSCVPLEEYEQMTAR